MESATTARGARPSASDVTSSASHKKHDLCESVTITLFPPHTDSTLNRLHNEPLWIDRRHRYKLRPGADLVSWIFDTGSLTRRLQSACDTFAVRVISQNWGYPQLNESQKLAMRYRERALIRQVHLLCNGQPVVFARTVIPCSTLRGSQRRLTRLGGRSLGAVLFADKSMRRAALQIARITPQQTIYTIAMQHLPASSHPIWGRRSVFTLNKRPLLVSEVFLPAISYCKL